MSKKVKPFKNCKDYGSMRDYVENCGAYEVRCTGDHHWHEFDNGHPVLLAYKQDSDEVSDGVRSSIKKMLRAAGIVVIALLIAMWYIFPPMV